MNNNTVKVTYYVGGDASKQSFEDEIACDVSIAEFREAAKVKLGLPSSQAYRLLLEEENRQLRMLDGNKTFKSENVKQGDKLVFILVDNSSGMSGVCEDTSNSKNSLSLVTYTLALTVVSDSNNTKNYDYPINLEEFYEDNPERFFTDFNGRERKNFEAVLRYKVPKVVENFEIDKILRDWCEDISLGYRDTPITIRT